MGFWAAAAPILASMAGGAATSAIGNATSRDGYMGYDLPTMTPSPYDAENMRLMAELAQQGALNYQAGQLPPGMETLLNDIQARQLDAERQGMYGTPGDRGGSIMDNVMAAGAMGGVGPKAMMSQSSKAMNDYALRNSQIRNYIDSLKFSGLQRQGELAFNQLGTMPRSMEIPWAGQVVQQNLDPQPGVDIGLGNVDWVDWFDKYGPKKKKKGDTSTAEDLAPGVGYENDYNTISPVAGGGYVMGNQVVNTPPALPPLPVQAQYTYPTPRPNPSLGSI